MNFNPSQTLIGIVFLFKKSGREDETLPPETQLTNPNACLKKLSLNNNNEKLKVYTDLESVQKHLNDSRYTFVDDIYKADIIFIRKHFKNYK